MPYIKNSVTTEIQTWIVGVEGTGTDHYATTTAPLIKDFRIGDLEQEFKLFADTSANNCILLESV